MRWSVYKITEDRRTVNALGYVNAPDQPSAVRRATIKWPNKADWSRPSAGLSLREYTKDSFSLGRHRNG